MMKIIKRKHFLVIPLLFLTFLLFSTRKEEPAPIHGYVLVNAYEDSDLPAVQMAFQTVQQDAEGSVQVTPSEPLVSGTLFVRADKANGYDTGIAMLNPNDWEATITITFVGEDNRETAAIPIFTIPPYHKVARMLSEWLAPQGIESFAGQLKIDSSDPVFILGLQTVGDKIYNLPVISCDPVPVQYDGDFYAFPHFAFGGGYRCSLVFWNPTNEPLECEVNFYTSDGQPAVQCITGSEHSFVHLHLMPGETRRIFLGTNDLDVSD